MTSGRLAGQRAAIGNAERSAIRRESLAGGADPPTLGARSRFSSLAASRSDRARRLARGLDARPGARLRRRHQRRRRAARFAERRGKRGEARWPIRIRRRARSATSLRRRPARPARRTARRRDRRSSRRRIRSRPAHWRDRRARPRTVRRPPRATPCRRRRPRAATRRCIFRARTPAARCAGRPTREGISHDDGLPNNPRHLHGLPRSLRGPLIRLILRSGREESVLRRHPWLFSGAVARAEGDGTDGVAEVVDANGRVLAHGAYSPDSQIVARLWTFDGRVPDAALFRERFAAARRLREETFGDATTGFRAVNSEGDGCPGVVLDVYGETAVLELLTAGTEAWAAELEAAARDVFAPGELLVRRAARAGPGELPSPHPLPRGERERVRGVSGASRRVPFPRKRPALFRRRRLGSEDGLLSRPAREPRAAARARSRQERPQPLLVLGRLLRGRARRRRRPAPSTWTTSAAALELAREHRARERIRRPTRPTSSRRTSSRTCGAAPPRGSGGTWSSATRRPSRRSGRTSIGPRAATRTSTASRWRSSLRAGWLLTCSCSGLVDADLFQKIVFSASLDARRSVLDRRAAGRRPGPPGFPRLPRRGIPQGTVAAAGIGARTAGVIIAQMRRFVLEQAARVVTVSVAAIASSEVALAAEKAAPVSRSGRRSSADAAAEDGAEDLGPVVLRAQRPARLGAARPRRADGVRARLSERAGSPHGPAPVRRKRRSRTASRGTFSPQVGFAGLSANLASGNLRRGRRRPARDARRRQPRLDRRVLVDGRRSAAPLSRRRRASRRAAASTCTATTARSRDRTTSRRARVPRASGRTRSIRARSRSRSGFPRAPRPPISPQRRFAWAESCTS